MTEKTEQLPPMPAVDIKNSIPYESIRYIPGYPESFVREFARIHGEACWRAGMEKAAKLCEEERPNAPGPYCPWSDEDDARYEAFTDAISAIRSELAKGG